jgi:hypothetical protein
LITGGSHWFLSRKLGRIINYKHKFIDFEELFGIGKILNTRYPLIWNSQPSAEMGYLETDRALEAF